MILQGTNAEFYPAHFKFIQYLVEKYPETANIWGGLLLAITLQLLLTGLVWLTYSPCFASLLILKGAILCATLQFVGQYEASEIYNFIFG